MAGNKAKKVKRTIDRRTREKRESKDEIEARRAREARKARNRMETQKTIVNRVSYVKKPLAKRSLISIGLMVAAVFLLVLGLAEAVQTQGQAGLRVAAMGFCSILVGLFAIWYGVTAFLEKEKNYILARIGISVSGGLLVVWLVMIIIGLRG